MEPTEYQRLFMYVSPMIAIPSEIINRDDVDIKDMVAIKGFILSQYKKIFEKQVSEGVLTEEKTRVAHMEIVWKLHDNSIRQYPIFVYADIEIQTTGTSLEQSIWLVKEMSAGKDHDKFLDTCNEIKKQAFIDEDGSQVITYKEGIL